MENFRISISKLVVIDSVGVAIAEIDLSNGGIIIAKGNIGKTSILNAIRLFLLPETNFRKSFQKFGFMNNKGEPYSDDESYEHYFPSNASFLILECENYLGGAVPHCQILYRGEGNSKSYKRMFTSLSFDKIRDLFWDNTIGADDVGGAVADLSVNGIKKALKARDPKHFKLLEQSQAIKEAIYANELLSIDSMRYCLFPLNKIDEASINSFKALVKLLFDMKTGSDSVRLAIANIIESTKKERKDELNFDVNAFLNRNQLLINKEKQLQKIKNLKPTFEQLETAYQELQQNKSAEIELAKFQLSLNSEITNQSNIKKNIENEATGAKAKWDQAGKDLTAISTKQTELNGVIKKDQSQFDKYKAEVEKSQAIIDGYIGFPIAEIIEILAEELKKDIDSLANYKDTATRQNRIVELDSLILKGQKEVQRLQQSIDAKEFLLSEQLDADVLEKLASVNKTLIKANPGCQLSAVQSQALIDFTHLLHRDNEQFFFFDKALNIVHINDVDSSEIELQKSNEQLADWQDEYKTLSGLDSQNALITQKEIDNLERSINRYKNELERVNAHEFNTQRVNELSRDLAKYAQEIIDINKNAKEATKKEQICKQEYSDLKIQLDTLNEQLGNFKTLQQRADNCLARHNLSTLLFEKFEQFEFDNAQLTADYLTKLEDAISLKSQSRLSVINLIHTLVREQVIEDDDDLFTATLSDEQIQHSYQQIATKYQHIGDEINNVKSQFVGLKSEIHGIITELEKNRQLIKSFEKTINHEFEKVQINDLSNVSSTIGVDGRFEALLAEISHIDLHADSRLSDEFIDRLTAFSQKFFDEGKASTLTMDKIITGIDYQVKKEGKKSWETKSQSTSTVMLINIKLVETLLKNIRQSGCAIHFPLVIDEGASVDLSQFQWLLPQLKQAGFRVLSASTHSVSSELIIMFEHHFKLDSMKTAHPYHPERLIAYTSKPESIVLATETQLDQMSMFGDLDE